MKTKFLFCFLACTLISLSHVSAKNIFVIEGPEKSYNQIRVVNETSQSDFDCRVAVLNDDESMNYVYGVYHLKERNDIDSNSDTNRVRRGTKLAVQMPKDFPVEVSAFVEYKDYPFYDIIIIHLTDTTSEFSED